MNKFDTQNNEIMMGIDEAAKRHPKPGDGPVQTFPVWTRPLVKVNTMYGQAVAYTRSYGLIMWQDEARQQHMEWIAANLIQRVERSDWHGH